MESKSKKPKVFVGMSGGVDSSVSAAILKEAGFDVTGVFIKVWSPEWLPCEWKEERRDAMRCAAVLKIPFLTLDLEKEYKKEVIDNMISEYKIGRVPNPDVLCNKKVKFGAFFDWAMKNGADYVATGHYSINQKSKIKNQNCNLKIIDIYKLLQAKDKNKDQSYFLWTLTQKQLAKTLFPVGHFKKDEVRRLAEKFDLPTFKKKDSQGLCFLGKIDVKDFLKKHIKPKKGDVLSETGEIIGKHEGAGLYTVGERHGFSIFKNETNNLPYYVVDKNIKKNILVVSKNKKEKIIQKEVEIDEVNWITNLPESNKKYHARVRYRGDLLPCSVLISKKNKAKVIFEKSDKFISSGQSIVVYDGDICMGGGVIV